MLELPVMFNPEGSAQLAALGLESKLSDSVSRPVFFCVVDCFHPYQEDGKEYTMLWCNGEHFVVDLPYEKAKKVILT